MLFIRSLYIPRFDWWDLANTIYYQSQLCKEGANGLRYLRWGGDGEAVQPEK
jgi:hypothetical protein